MRPSGISWLASSTLVGVVAVAQSLHQPGHHQALAEIKRGLMPCVVACGEGWTRRGGSAERLFYQAPGGLRQSCCVAGEGELNGTPASGYYRPNDGERLGTHARNGGGLSLPDYVSGPPVDSATLEIPSVAFPTGHTPSNTTTTTTAVYDPAEGAVTPASNTRVPLDTAATSSPIVQVSIAIREQWTLTWMVFAMAVVGGFMASC